MFLFSFRKFPGFDSKDADQKQVFSFDRVFYSSQNIGKQGDLLYTDDDILLHLGEEISFPEMYRSIYPPTQMKIKYKDFFDTKYLALLHWMVYERYSSYKNVMKLFIDMEVSDVLKKESKLTKKSHQIETLSREGELIRENSVNPKETYSSEGGEKSGKDCTLMIFPDNWTLYNTLDEKKLQEDGLIVLSSLDSPAKKITNWRNIKKGAVHTIVSTHSEVFQPFLSLDKITIYDPEKRYYNSQQDPRYHLPIVVRQIAKIYGAKLSSGLIKVQKAPPNNYS